ncbi:MAG TPA: ABC transporter ATP-binding protein [Chloroflexota bacterium]|nr:ABC transporter ATP-binding protein [Chloroflexota bacterium]
MATADVLRVEDLRVWYHTPLGPVKAVDGVTFGLQKEERLGLVGESGSGKSTIAQALMRLIRPPGKIEGGVVNLEGIDVLGLPDEQMRQLRLASIALVAQGAMNSLNPVVRVREQIVDAMKDHGENLSKQAAQARVVQLLDQVGLKPEVGERFPHELSGGMKQRVCIAIAICLRPKVILADEPTSALDVVVQRQVMDTLGRVQQELGASVVLVGHDMGLMAQFADRLGVMYAGRLVEVSPVRQIFAEPLHPYTRLLIASLPSIKEKGNLRGIPGQPPSLLNKPVGCAFHPRCPFAMPRCTVVDPPLEEVRSGRFVACHLFDPDVAQNGQALPSIESVEAVEAVQESPSASQAEPQ